MLEIECGVPIKPGAENRGSLLQPKELPSTRYTQSNEACKICLPKNPVTYPLDTYIENIQRPNYELTVHANVNIRKSVALEMYIRGKAEF